MCREGRYHICYVPQKDMMILVKDSIFETNSGHATAETYAVCNMVMKLPFLIEEENYSEEHMFCCFLQ